MRTLHAILPAAVFGCLLGIVLGVGLGVALAAATYLTFAAENGFMGLALFLGLVGSTIARSRRVRRRCRSILPNATQQLRYLEIGLIAFLIAGIWGSYGKLAFLYVHVALIWAMAAAVEAEWTRARQAAATGAVIPAPAGG